MASALAKQVAAENRRARSMGMAGTLTTLDWQRTLKAFRGCCAYCGDLPAVTIDHFIPLAFGGATMQSNCVPSCLSCNRLKADIYPDEHTLPSLSKERLEEVRSYLEEIGRRHQESLNKLWERVPKLAHDQLAAQALKRYCEQRARETDDPCAAPYARLCQRIFGVPWDPAYAFQVLESLRWQQAHASDRLDAEASKDALRFFTAELAQDRADLPRL